VLITTVELGEAYQLVMEEGKAFTLKVTVAEVPHATVLLAEMLGLITETVSASVEIQFAVLVTETLYTIDMEGETTILLALLPVFQVYVDAVVTRFRVAVLPRHNKVEVAAMFNVVSLMLTATEDCGELQPFSDEEK
jgi:hypothetical protein